MHVKFLLCRELRQKDVTKLHVQLCMALTLLLAIFLGGIDRTGSEVLCTGMSFFIQYFALVSVFWMGAEAILMTKKLVIVFGTIPKKFFVIISIICWGMLINTMPHISRITLCINTFSSYGNTCTQTPSFIKFSLTSLLVS